MKKDIILVRRVLPSDAAALARIYKPYVDETAVTFEYTAPDEDEFRRRIDKICAKYPFIVAVKDNNVIGYCYASVFKERDAYSQCVEISVYVDKNNRARGTGTLLYKVIEKKLREIGIKNVYACIAYPETDFDPRLTSDSVLFHKKMGYTLCGYFKDCGIKFGEDWSIIWMEKQI